MSAALYQNELTSLVSESKRRHPDIKSAAEKALQDLKGISVTSEQQLAVDIRCRPEFIDAFLKACTTGNTKLAISGVNALQRLVISQALPITRLDEALQAFNACADLGLEIQLKVLQALPSLVQNYAEELRGDLLGSALQVCAALQGAKVSTISAVAAATLQQLVAAVFVRVTEEDARLDDASAANAVHGEDGTINIKPAAYDAYRVFRDLVLAAEGRSTTFVQLSTLSQEECLELIASCIEAKPQLVQTHQELSKIIRTGVVSLAATCLTDQLTFTVTVRCIRLLRLLSLRYFDMFHSELEPAISLFAHTMEAESSPLWKRVLVMELLRDMFVDHSLIVKAYIAYDQGQNKAVIQDLLAGFVRLSAEKPAVIGLGQHSTSPVIPTNRDNNTEQFASDLVGNVTGMLNSFGVIENNVQGISAHWSLPKSACYEQLDKTQPPQLPETYIYSLVLDCLHGFSDMLAKIVLPLTTNQSAKSRHDRTADHNDQRLRAAAGLVESCWPAVLATCSTFMNATLDDGYYRALIKAYQRFAQVAGLLRLDTPRDALMTTLGKAAVPPQVLNAATTEMTRSPVSESPRVFSNPKNLLSIESLVSQASSSLSAEKERRSSMEQTKPVLTVRNLLCLRALLNLAIALGPTLQNTFTVVVQVLKQADIVLSASGPHQLARSNIQSDPPAMVQSFSAEVTAVEAAASRLLESTADYPDEALLIVLHEFGDLLQTRPSISTPTIAEELSIPSSPMPRQRTFSGLPGTNGPAETQSRAFQFVLPKLGHLAALNVPRFVSSDVETSGWAYLVDQIVPIASSNVNPTAARRSAADLLCRLAAECIAEVAEQEEDVRTTIQARSFALLLRIVTSIYEEDGQLTNSDLEVQSHVVNSVKVILEQSGETVIAGWDKISGILSTTFECDRGTATDVQGDEISVDWTCLSNEFVSLRLGRDAFSILQLLIADFFDQLPVKSSAAIIELLFRFMSQSEDLNLSLTAITASWNVADRLFNAREEDITIPDITTEQDSANFEAQLSTKANTRRSAQWVLLLVKLRQIVQFGQREPAKAAFQTVCSIGKNIDTDLPIRVWAVVLRHILIGVLADDSSSTSWEERSLTPILLDGVATTIAQQMEMVNRLPKLGETWTDLMKLMTQMLQREHLDTTTAVYKALCQILSPVNELSPAWNAATLDTAMLWTNCSPEAIPNTGGSNQATFLAYTDLGAQLLRLRAPILDQQLAEDLISHLAQCVRKSGATVYSADCQSLSPVQAAVLSTLRSIPANIKGVVAQQIATACEFTLLHKGKSSATSSPSFVALGAESIAWLGQLIEQHKPDAAMIQHGSLERAMTCLADVIEEKYHFQMEHKGAWLWQRATETAITISTTIASQVDVCGEEARTNIWRHYIRIARNVIHAHGLDTFEDDSRAYNDEHKDIKAVQTLYSILVPRIGASWLSDDDINSYTMALFHASIIHPIEGTEMPQNASSAALRGIASIRRGRVKKVLPSRREDMSYECLSQLVSLVSGQGSPELQRLAGAAMPLLILRLAIPVQAYIADQPLRGHMPQPLSELDELLHAFECIGKLQMVVSEADGTWTDAAHLRYLYPLLTKAVRVAGDKWCGSREVLEPLQALLEKLSL